AGRQRILAPEVVEAGEEGGQRFARAGRGEDEGVLARGDGGPALPLRGGRFAQGGAKPLADGRQEEVEGIGRVHAYIIGGRPAGARGVVAVTRICGIMAKALPE